MKKILLVLGLGLASYCSYAQNTYPWASTGNVGIGTSAPRAQFSVVSGTDNAGTFFPTGNAVIVGANNSLTSNTANLAISSNSAQGTDIGSSIGLGGRWLGAGDGRDIGFSIIKGAKENATAGDGSGYLAFGTYGSGGMVERMRIASSGNVGIGTTNPTAALQIGEVNGAAGNKLLIPGVYNFEQVRLGQISNGNSALEFVNHTGGGASYGIKFLVDVDSGAPGLQLQFAPSAGAYNSLNYTTGLYMNLLGNIGLGTTTPDTKLAVNGTIHTKEVKVDIIGWPDYVFKPKYELLSLAEVKTYIDKNEHLPEMPSETEVAKNGINLGEMNKILVKKVEELTLYQIEQQEKSKQQEARIAALEATLSKLTNNK